MGAAPRHDTMSTSTLTFARERNVTPTGPGHPKLAPRPAASTPAAALTVALTFTPPWRHLTGTATHGRPAGPAPVAPADQVMTLDDIATRVAAAAAQAVGLAHHDAILSGDRSADVALARHLTIVIARRHGFTLTEIGSRLDRSHTSCSVAATNLHARADGDPEIAALMERVDWLWRQPGPRAARRRPQPPPALAEETAATDAPIAAQEPPATSREMAAQFGRLDPPDSCDPLQKANDVRMSRAAAKRAVNDLDPPDAVSRHRRRVAGERLVGTVMHSR